MEVKPEFLAATTGREDLMFDYVKSVLGMPDTSMTDFIDAEQQVERLRDGFIDYFQRYDALLCPVTPIPAHRHGASEFVIEGRTVPRTHAVRTTVPST